ncbi:MULTISPECIES: hypothetical protein [Klebsiella]|uniref:hypothetical protein n=1 Tax=Klebsiella TaxID=570 RepID=UPI000F66927D|nr:MULTISPECIES: hypothetical protein [Klebsiella]MCP6422261.1 hypothetical protein [Klebsiella pneumoniae]RRZ70211.1 hypothetical protein EGK39_23760 [Klebsiella oxytoca]
MIKKIYMLIGCGLLAGCGLLKGPPVYKPYVPRVEEPLIYTDAWVYSDCMIYDRETKLTYYSKNKIISANTAPEKGFIGRPAQFMVIDQSSPFGHKILSPKLHFFHETGTFINRSSAETDDYYYGQRGLLNQYYLEFAIIHKPTNTYRYYECDTRVFEKKKIRVEDFLVIN